MKKTACVDLAVRHAVGVGCANRAVPVRLGDDRRGQRIPLRWVPRRPCFGRAGARSVVLRFFYDEPSIEFARI